MTPTLRRVCNLEEYVPFPAPGAPKITAFTDIPHVLAMRNGTA
jgi:hypothetical protein